MVSQFGCSAAVGTRVFLQLQGEFVGSQWPRVPRHAGKFCIFHDGRSQCVWQATRLYWMVSCIDFGDSTPEPRYEGTSVGKPKTRK